MDMDSAAGLFEVDVAIAKKRRLVTLEDMGDDVLCMIFAFLDLLNLVRCSAVCKSWCSVIDKLKYLRVQNINHFEASSKQDLEINSGGSINSMLEQLAFKQHALSLRKDHAHVIQWKGHSVGFKKCRMKRGVILTGVGDKVMRLWSAKSCNELENYHLIDKAPLVDFDFDASKIVGLVGTRLCIWKRTGNRDMFSSRLGLFRNGLCLSYADPQAVVGCEDGRVRVYDMYGRNISNIVRMHPHSVSCVLFSDDQLIISGSSHGSISISDLSSDQKVTTLSTNDSAGIRTLCHNPRSHILFTGSNSGFVSCWDLRKLGRLWETRVSPSMVLSMDHLRGDTLTLAVGGIDGVLRIIDQDNGELLSRWIIEPEGKCRKICASSQSHRFCGTKAVKLCKDDRIDLLSSRPPITCLGVGMQKIVSVHGDGFIRLWKFRNQFAL